MPLNENNIQAPFQYKISENTFELLKRSGELELNTNNKQVKVFSGQRLFCADIGYAVDGPLENMEFLIDDIKVYPQLLENLKDLQTVDVKDNEIYLVNNDIDFKSIIFFPPSDLNKNFKFTITTYSSTFSSFMFDEIAKKLNTLDTNYPVKNYYENIDYKVNDIVKNNGYLYRVFKEFTSDGTDYYLKTNCNLLTPFKKLELDTDYKANELIEYNNDFLIVQKDFRYENKDGVLTDLSGLLKPLQDIDIWFDGIAKIYKNQIIIKDNFSYIVLEDIENPVWGNIQNKIDYFNKASNTFYDDSVSIFGDNTNTTQKAIEKLQAKKQNNLIAGNNINIVNNRISVNGGTNKEYVSNDTYYIDDLIIYDSKLYKVNEDFIATEWIVDINKCTLVSGGGSGGTVKAIDVSYDNSETNLEYLAGYDFPKFKVAISGTINLTFEDNFFGDGSKNSAAIVKENNEYRLKGSISVTNINHGLYATFYINDKSNIYEHYSIISQFFNFTKNRAFNNDDYIDAETGEIIVDGIEAEWKFCFVYTALYSTVSKCKLYIEKKDGSSFNSGKYNITLNIKNRVLKPEDRNIFAVNSNFQQDLIASLCNLELNEIGSSVKLQGTFTSSIYNVGTSDGLFFYSPIIENYFNLIDDISNLKATTGITSSSGKAVKFGITKTSDSPVSNISKYILVVGYQDGSNIQQRDVFTFNLTPDKNSALDSIYQDVANVQQLGQALAKRYNIPLFVDVYPEDDGTFDDRKRPANYYKTLYNVTTVWKKRFADKAVFFRSQGTKSNVNRSNGLQPAGMLNLRGTIVNYGNIDSYSKLDINGVFSPGLKFGLSYNIGTIENNQPNNIGEILFNSKNQVREYTNDIVVDNYEIEIYELVSINGINIWGE